VERHGLPTKKSLKRHSFVDSEIYASHNSLWEPWRQLTLQGNLVAFADASITHGMLVKSGMGIGLLGNYCLVEPNVVALDLDCHISLRLHLVAIRERLKSRPVRVVAHLLKGLFCPSNPWFAEALNLTCPDPRFTKGLNTLFNLPSQLPDQVA
jgi:hypothetical protein